MKATHVRVNKCDRCGDEAGNFVWSSSRQIHTGIRVMYPDCKICQTCLKEMQSKYPPREIGKGTTVERKPCPECGSNAWTEERRHTIVDPRPNSMPDTACRSEINSAKNVEIYCSVCGYVEDVE